MIAVYTHRYGKGWPLRHLARRILYGPPHRLAHGRPPLPLHPFHRRDVKALRGLDRLRLHRYRRGINRRIHHGGEALRQAELERSPSRRTYRGTHEDAQLLLARRAFYDSMRNDSPLCVLALDRRDDDIRKRFRAQGVKRASGGGSRDSRQRAQTDVLGRSGEADFLIAAPGIALAQAPFAEKLRLRLSRPWNPRAISRRASASPCWLRASRSRPRRESRAWARKAVAEGATGSLAIKKRMGA